MTNTKKTQIAREASKITDWNNETILIKTTTKKELVTYIASKITADQPERYKRYLMTHTKNWLIAMINRINKES